MPSLDDLPANCPRCGAAIYSDGKETSSGVDSYMYFCEKHCGWLETYEGGISLWKAMSIANSSPPPPSPPQPTKPKAPWWKFWAR